MGQTLLGVNISPRPCERVDHNTMFMCHLATKCFRKLLFLRRFNKRLFPSYQLQPCPTGPQLQPGLVCEHSTMSIQCPAHKVIRIQSAMYGRAPGGSVCGTVYTGAPCRSPTSLPVLQERCDGREACSVRAENGVFGDPCVGTFKYLAVEYECVGVPGWYIFIPNI